MMLITDKNLLFSENSQFLHPHFPSLSVGCVAETANKFSRSLAPDRGINVKSAKTMVNFERSFLSPRKGAKKK